MPPKRTMILAGQILSAAEALEIVDACPKLPRAVVALLSRGGGGALPLLVLPDMQWDAGYEAALGTLKKQDLQTAVSQADHGSNTRSQSYKVTVRLTMEAVCLLKGVEPSWAAGKALLGDRHFVQSLQEFDKDRIPETTLAKLQKYIQMEDFRPEVVQNSCRAASPLCRWVRCVDTYAKAAKAVPPNQRELLAEQEQSITQLSQELDTLSEQIKLERPLATQLWHVDAAGCRGGAEIALVSAWIQRGGGHTATRLSLANGAGGLDIDPTLKGSPEGGRELLAALAQGIPISELQGQICSARAQQDTLLSVMRSTQAHTKAALQEAIANAQAAADVSAESRLRSIHASVSVEECEWPLEVEAEREDAWYDDTSGELASALSRVAEAHRRDCLADATRLAADATEKRAVLDARQNTGGAEMSQRFWMLCVFGGEDLN